ncbi:MAG TPA: hypothetical protein PK036_12390 [Geobacteraceae bacterium]|nr:hypothetical protein [Geobacteraceae bacterium]
MECHVSCGCEEMQGYYFSHPVPVEECGALLTKGWVTVESEYQWLSITSKNSHLVVDPSLSS